MEAALGFTGTFALVLKTDVLNDETVVLDRNSSTS